MSARATASAGRTLACLVASLVVLLAACAGAASRRDVVVLPPPADLVVAMRARLGQDFVLGDFPEHAASPGELFEFLVTTHGTRTLLTRWQQVHATQFTIEVEERPANILVFAANAGFTGDLVYAVSIAGDGRPRTIYVYRNRF